MANIRGNLIVVFGFPGSGLRTGRHQNIKMCHIDLSVCIKRMIKIIVFIYVFFLFPSISIASDRPLPNTKKGNDATSIRKRLRGRYKIKNVRLSKGPDGFAGNFFISGDLTDDAVIKSMEVIDENALRSIARSFLTEQADIFGISNLDEDIREISMKTDRHGRTHIAYHRYIHGLRLDEMSIIMHMEEDGKIFAINGYLVPVSPSLINKLASKTESGLSEDEIKKIIGENLEPDGFDPVKLLFNKLEKVIIPSDPYIVWKADVISEGRTGRWDYYIDALTGSVLKKMDSLQFFQPSPPNTSENISPNAPQNIKIRVNDQKGSEFISAPKPRKSFTKKITVSEEKQLKESNNMSFKVKEGPKKLIRSDINNNQIQVGIKVEGVVEENQFTNESGKIKVIRKLMQPIPREKR
jgi:hypothetical protein